ncbi:MAG TPA: sigma-54-dependent Fis family transcriptional regulator [Sedimenticola thiotaurini]|uniref:Sigma-54-dependent Fis family transcriptional regulator n=1 Tax=Sedimenticola thiotaurini TaxID=1543721 RepID=A0A831W4P2_9GAMM|nr:sigma-54-dependent Fis family transcriptional regulator [Sedimenticola thiotaurini]
MDDRQHRLLGSSPLFLQVVHAARMVAPTDATVLVTGERGVGKELLAREIHLHSRRRNRPFRVVGCAGVSPEQFARELDEADATGTLFLDEVGELAPVHQAGLMHLLDALDGKARLIASSSLDLYRMMQEGGFREDLYFRLNVVPLELPPLRQRSDDIVNLLKQFSQQLARSYGRRPPRYSVTSRNILKAYPWPGNVRELKNFCQRMAILMTGRMVQPEDLPPEIRRAAAPKPEHSPFTLPPEGIDLAVLEGEMIRQALGMTGGNRSKAARLLGISRDTLLYRMQKHAIRA